jgi:hypothetical protein
VKEVKYHFFSRKTEVDRSGMQEPEVGGVLSDMTYR